MNTITFLKSLKKDMLIFPEMIEKLQIINIKENRFNQQTLEAAKALKDMIDSFVRICKGIKRDDLAVSFNLLSLACDPILEANQNPKIITKGNLWQYFELTQKAIKLAKEAIRDYNKATKHL